MPVQYLAAISVVIMFAPWILINLTRGRLLWSGLLAGTLMLGMMRSSSLVTALAPLAAKFITLAYGLSLLALLSGALLGRRRPGIRLPLIPVVLFWLLMAFGVAVGLTDPLREFAGLAPVMLIGSVATVAYLRRWCHEGTLRQDLLTVYWTVAGSVIVSAGLGFLGPWWAFGGFAGLQGLYPNQNYLGLAAALVASMATGRILTKGLTRSMVDIVLLVVSVVALLWTGSRGSLLALGTGVLVAISLAWRDRSRRNLVVLATLSLVGCGAVLFFLLASYFSREERGVDFLTGRGEIWAELLGRVTWIGKGLYSIQRTGLEVGTDGLVAQNEPLAAHNIYLQFLVGVGVLGATLWIAFVVCLFVGARKSALLGTAGPAAVALLTYELTESSLLGAGGPLVAASWLILFALAAASRLEPVTEELADPLVTAPSAVRVRAASDYRATRSRLAAPVRRRTVGTTSTRQTQQAHGCRRHAPG